MKKILATLAPALLVRNLTLLAGVYVCYRYLGDFTSQQSAFLTAAAWGAYNLYKKLKNLHTAADAFSPFSVCIRPKWYTLLSDFKLIRTEDEWRKLCETVNETPVGEYTALRDGFTFTVIKPPGEDDVTLPRLTFWDNRKVFLTTMELSEPIIPIDVEFFPRCRAKKKSILSFITLKAQGFCQGFVLNRGSTDMRSDWRLSMIGGKSRLMKTMI